MEHKTCLRFYFPLLNKAMAVEECDATDAEEY
jgi:hypothetical protein